MRYYCLTVIGAWLISSEVLSASDIPLPDNSFEGISTSINPPTLLGTTSGSIGAWSAKFTGLLSLGGKIRSGTSSSLGGPSSTDGTYELNINLPASASVSADLSQVLTNKYLPNSTYTLSVDLDQGASIGLINGVSISLKSGSTNLATLTSDNLASLIDTSAGLQTVELVYKTGNTVSTNGIGIDLSASGLLAVGGNIYADNFKLSVEPTKVNVVAVGTGNGTTVTLNGSGGAPLQTYQVITSTNLLEYVTNWTRLSTNQFDINGNFIQSIPVDPDTPYRFFRTVLP